MAIRLRRPAGGWLALILLTVVLLCPVASVVAADWVDHLNVLYWVTLGGLLFGFVFARVPAPGSVLHPLALLVGTGAVFYAVASTAPRLPPGLGRMLLLWERLVRWVGVVQRGGFGNEPILFLLMLAAMAWIVAYLGAWSVYRDRSAWWPLVAGGTALVVNASHAPEVLGYVLPFVVASLLLMARLNLYQQELAWQAAGLRHGSGIWGGTLRTGLALSLLVAGFGWFAPELPPRQDVYDSVYQASQPLRDFENEFNRAFGGIRGRGGAAPSLSGFSNSLVLGGQFRLASYPVLRITSAEPRYWRAVVYERYTGQGWVIAQPTTPVQIAPGAPLPAPEQEQRQEQREELTQVVEVLQPRGNYVVGANQPTRVDLPVTAEAWSDQRRGGSRGSGPSGPLDVVALHAPLAPGKHYTVISSVSRATPALLRKAGDAYPRDIALRYRALPQVPQRVRDLALQLTRSSDNAYDKARAVEAYLRTFAYTLEVTPSPPDRDAVDYFLFDLKAGYCDYFASAMAVMLRSVGIPARVVSGYATGVRESASGPFVVRDDNAHSWVEVYFPRYGWIEFDPTPSQPLIEHPMGTVQPTPTPDELATPEAGADEATGLDEPPRDPAASLPLLEPGPGEELRTVAAVLAVAALAAGMLVALWRAGLAGLPPAAAAYARVAQLASLLGWQPRRTETPHEFTRRLSRLAPGQTGSLRLISDSFVAFRFGHRAATPGEGPILAAAWQNVRGGMLRAAARRVERALMPRRPDQGPR